ncbi:MAG: Fe-S cluster assembly ATPase SufC [Parcubacteria group bacterium]|nr:Fe-S cluster assembly ATPase SufC [Parcubacteria group bacterium]
MVFKAHNIHITAQSGTEVVSGVSLMLKKGECAVLMGKNGSGKSSLILGCMGHPAYAITEGALMLCGEDVTHASTKERAKKGLFLSPQTPPPLSGVALGTFLRSADENVHPEENYTPLAFHKALSAKIMDAGFDTELLSKPVNTELSGGQKKQTEIIQLLALSPKVALLDEIDSGVDIETLGTVCASIRKVCDAGTAVLVVTHNPEVVKQLSPDRVYVMRDGVIVAEGDASLAEKVKEGGFISLED